MAGWHRLERHLFDGLTCLDITQPSAVEAPYGIRAAKYASYASTASGVGPTHMGRAGLKVEGTDPAGSMPLWGTQVNALRCYGSIFVPTGITRNARPIYAGVVVFANDGSASSQVSVFSGLTCGAGYSAPTWIVALMNASGELVRYASLPAASLSLGAQTTPLTRPFKVITEGNAVTLVTPDGSLVADTTPDQSNLSAWYGERFISTGSSAPSGTLLIEAIDWQFRDIAYTPPHDAWDTTKRLPDFAPLLDFAPEGGEYLITSGTTPAAYDPDDVVCSANSMVMAANSKAMQRIEWVPASPLDLRGKCLALISKPVAPDQLQYTTDTLATNVTLPQDSISLTGRGASFKYSTQGGGAGEPSLIGGSVDLAGNTVFFTSISGGALRGCRGGSGTIPAGTTVSQHTGQSKSPASLVVQLAASAAAYTAGNYLEYDQLALGMGTWTVSTWLLQGKLGVEGRTRGNASRAVLSSVGYVQLLFHGDTLPFSAANGAAYDGPQPSQTALIKWDTLATFSNEGAPTIVFTFDDSHQSDRSLVAPALETPRPGFPNGMRGTFHEIFSNLGENGFTTEFDIQKMSAGGHEICLHVMDKVHHASPPSGGDGPLGHYEVVHPGGTQIDQAAEIAALKGLGIDGPYAFALPYGQSEPAVTGAAVANGVVGTRTTNGGGMSPMIVGSGANADCSGFVMQDVVQRFVTEPPGDNHHLPSLAQARDLRSGDQLGQRIAERAILEACLQNGTLVIYDHQMFPGAKPSSARKSWNQAQFNEVLAFISDLKTGQNNSGRNPSLESFPTIRVVTLTEALTGSSPAPASPEAWGVSLSF
jgi:hypothetical protein